MSAPAIFDGQPLTKRETLIAREAYLTAIGDRERRVGPINWVDIGGATRRVDDAVVERYPLPKVRRPRVHKTVMGYEYRVIDGQLQIGDRTTGGWGAVSEGWGDDIKAVVALFDNPTEEVEE